MILMYLNDLKDFKILNLFNDLKHIKVNLRYLNTLLENSYKRI